MNKAHAHQGGLPQPQAGSVEIVRLGRAQAARQNILLLASRSNSIRKTNHHHKMKPLLHQSYGGDMERIVAIEYHPSGRRHTLTPFSVFTVDEETKREPKEHRISGCYDFDQCRTEGQTYYHCSGGGGRFYIHPRGEPKKNPKPAVWWERSLVAPTNGGKSGTVWLTDRIILQWGYKILAAPLGNPFDGANVNEGEVEYCNICKDFLPTESNAPCDHLRWCDTCANWSGPGASDGNCDHVSTGLALIGRRVVLLEDGESIGCVPTATAQKMLAFVLAHRKSGWTGKFNLPRHSASMNRIDPKFGVLIGCQQIPWKEIDRFLAKEAQLQAV